MITFTNEGILLEKTNLEFESQAVLNPAYIEVDGIIHMFYRAVRPGNFSTIGYCQLDGNKVIYRLDKPLLEPEYDYEKHGLEDPRIVYLDGMYHLFYVGYDGRNSVIAHATSKDLVNFEKHGPISPSLTYTEAREYFHGLPKGDQYLNFESIYRYHRGEILLWEKDAFLFPRKFNGKYAMVHRVLPGIQIIYFDNFAQLNNAYWVEYFNKFGEYIVMDPEHDFENSHIGGGCPPIETADGWLFIYHAVEKTERGNIYHAAAALLDLENPGKVLARLPYPLFSPQEPWELQGDVNNVVFPTGAVIKGDKLFVYYGAADKLIAAKSCSVHELLTELKRHPVVRS